MPHRNRTPSELTYDSAISSNSSSFSTSNYTTNSSSLELTSLNDVPQLRDNINRPFHCVRVKPQYQYDHHHRHHHHRHHHHHHPANTSSHLQNINKNGYGNSTPSATASATRETTNASADRKASAKQTISTLANFSSLQTKLLIAIIVSLLLVIIALALFNRSVHDQKPYSSSRALSRSLLSSSNQNNNNNQSLSTKYEQQQEQQHKSYQQSQQSPTGATSGPLMSASSNHRDFHMNHPGNEFDSNHNDATEDDSSSDQTPPLNSNRFSGGGGSAGDNNNNDDNDTDTDNEGNGNGNGNNNDNDADKRDIDQTLTGRRRPARPVDSNNSNRRPYGNQIVSNNKLLRDPDAICMTPGCIRAAAQILNNMDNKTEPCEDFYQFACGRWMQTQVIPDEKTSLSIFSQNTADLNVKLRALVERKPNRDDPPIVGQLRNMFVSCMNLSDIETRGDGPLLDVLEDLGGWPVLTHSTSTSTATTTTTPASAADEPSIAEEPGQQLRRRRRRLNPKQLVQLVSQSAYETSWLDIIGKFRERGFSHDMIIDLSVVADARNSERYIVELDQSSLGLPDRSYYSKGLNDTTVSAYYKLMIESAVMLGAPRDEAERQMSEAFKFEASLASISLPRDQRRNVTRLYNKMPAIELYKLAPNIDWQRYLNAVLRDDQFDLAKDEILVKVPSFIRALDGLLQKTEPIVVANYMIWRIVRSSMNSLSRRWRELAHSYSSVITGRQIEEPRWEQCLNSLEGTLNAALSALYVKNHFNEQSKAAALEMVVYIRGEFLRILDEIDWMDEETRDEARSKAQAISHFIGYPDELLQDDMIEDYYKGIEISRENFYQNTRRLRIWSTNYAFGQLRKQNKRGEWKKHARAAVVNAFYNPIENSIEFPAGILQGAFFDAERPKYLNFGAIGYVIGHEITHGFDDRGRQFDKNGNNRNWWKPKTDARFRERAQCIIDQYGNYTVSETGTKVNGFTTQGENIADNGGVKQAFRSYRRWTKDHGREPRLPGLNYTPDQLFWISAANIWCGKFRPEVLKLRLNSGVHSPARYRVIGPLSNSPEFAQSFNCPIGTAMNPAKKCSVW